MTYHTYFKKVWIKQNFEHIIVNIFLPINSKKYVLDCQKNRLTETVLLNTHNICFG